ncbi:MAG: hypothetical protein JWQ74_463 [Marmoricola sp.]|nr:hypothetical protein [Marmoricola sp.]
MPAPDPVRVEQELTNQLASVNDAQVATITAAWIRAFSEVSTDLEQILTTIITTRASGGIVNARDLRRSRQLAVALDGIGQKLEDLTSQAGVTVTSNLASVVRRGVDSTDRLIDAQLELGQVVPGLDLGRLPDSRQLEAIVTGSHRQITSLLRPVAPETEEAIRRELIRGVTIGSNPKVTARRIVLRVNDKAQVGRARAENIARTETLDAYRNAAQAGEKQHAKLLAGWVWLAHLSPTTCPSCLARHGTFHDLDEAGPHDHPQGQCARMTVVRRHDGSVNLSFVPDARRYLDNLAEADQVSIMGRKRLELLNSGAIDFADLTTERQSPTWRPSWVVTPLRDLQAIASKAA